MSLEMPDQSRLHAAHGYVELGMYDAANAELEEIEPLCRHLPEILTARVAIYRALKKWDLMAIFAAKLVGWNPGEPGHFVNLAYAQRRAESLEVAYHTLTRAAGLHPNDGTIQFNLACYEAQMGNLNKANEHLTRATAIDPKFKLMAMGDSDLEPLWALLTTD